MLKLLVSMHVWCYSANVSQLNTHFSGVDVAFDFNGLSFSLFQIWIIKLLNTLQQRNREGMVKCKHQFISVIYQ